MTYPRTKLSSLTIALESCDMDSACISRFDRETGEVVFVETAVLESVEKDSDYAGNDLPDWQRKEIETARALLANDGSRFIDPPSRGPRDEIETMGAFAEQWPDQAVSSDLLRQLGGRGSFRRFREAVFEHRIEDEWRAFRDGKERDVLVAWCRENGVDYEDDLHIGSQRHETSDREHLLAAARWFVEEAGKLEEVEQVALVGSLCTEQKKPRDLDLLVTVRTGASIKALAKLNRRLQGRISRGSLGSDIFIVEDGRYIGRACRYREPWPRVVCASGKLRCAEGREFLCDTSDNFILDQRLVDDPPVILWPQARQNADVPTDVQHLLASLSADTEPTEQRKDPEEP